jgi:hypothetical protein
MCYKSVDPLTCVLIDTGLPRFEEKKMHPQHELKWLQCFSLKNDLALLISVTETGF